MSDRENPSSAPSPAGSSDRQPTRREFVIGSFATAVALGGWAARSVAKETSAASDGQASFQPKVLTPEEAAIYDAWCDQLAPGAAAAGVARYVDDQLAAPRDDCLLFLRVMSNPPFVEFYRQGIAGIEKEVRARFGNDATFVDLDAEKRGVIVEAAASADTKAWKEPAPGFFFFVSRSDAVDLAFGTVAGFDRLDVPYRAHIRPTSAW